MFSTGGLTDPRDTDPRFEVVEQAIKEAMAQSCEPFLVQPRAVWDDETGEILYIVHEGILYTS